MRLPFIGPTYKHRSLAISAQRCVNLYAEKTEATPGKEGEVAALLATPGLVAITNPTDFGAFGSAVRGGRRLNDGRALFVVGNTVVVVSSVGPPATFTNRGTLLTSTGAVSIADNGFVAIIVDGPYGYVMSLTAETAAAQITDPEFTGSDSVVFVSGFFVFKRLNSGQFYYTGLYSTDIDALDFQTAEGLPDNLVGLAALNSELWALGTQSTDIFYVGSDPDNAFSQNKGASSEYGCAARAAIVILDSTVLWLGQDANGGGIVVRAEGYAARRVSTHVIEQALQSVGDMSAAVAYGYQQDGHTFYVLNVPGLSTTFVYDLSTNEWHERALLNTVTGELARHPAEHHVFAFGQHIVGRHDMPMLYQLSQAATTDDGVPIVRIRSSPVISKELRQIYFNSLQLDIEAGVGLDGSPVVGADPVAELRWSDDSGATWTPYDAVPLGRLGQHAARVIWRRLGRGRNRVFEVRISDPVRVAIVGVTLDAVAGES